MTGVKSPSLSCRTEDWMSPHVGSTSNPERADASGLWTCWPNYHAPIERGAFMARVAYARNADEICVELAAKTVPYHPKDAKVGAVVRNQVTKILWPEHAQKFFEEKHGQGGAAEASRSVLKRL